jgi:hypothetical protein
VRLRALLVALLVLAATAPAAFADDFDQVFKDYSSDGRIDPCKHSAAQLQRARKDVPPDIEQYAPDFPDALDQAIEARAPGRGGGEKNPAPAGPSAAPSGSSGPVGSTQPAPETTTGANGATTTGAAGAPPAPTADSAPPGAPNDDAIARAASAHDGGGSSLPAPLIALVALAGVLAVAGLVAGLARWRGWEPPWALRARHALGEAGWRAGNTWSEFADWVRLGR